VLDELNELKVEEVDEELVVELVVVVELLEPKAR